MITPIEDVEDLAAQTKIQYGTLQNGSTMTFFRVSLKKLKSMVFKLVDTI